MQRYRLPYEIFRDWEKAKLVSMPKVWEIIDGMNNYIPQIMHMLYDIDGEPMDVTIKKISEELNLNYGKVISREARVMRTLRYSYSRKKYLIETEDSKEKKELRDFSTKELLMELIRRENG